MRRLRYIGFLMTLLLLLAGGATPAWAHKVTYHILTLPMDSTKSNTMRDVNGKRMEAVRVIVDDATTVGELPDHFKSPLAKNFKFYAASNVTNHGATSIYRARSTTNKYILYTITNPATTLSESTAIPSNDYHIYVTYEYDEANTIAKLDGSEAYNIEINGRFMALNKGRNNRLCMIPSTKVSGEQLASDDFVYVDVSGTGITAWYSANPTKPRDKAESHFHFLFKYKGLDPYNITICTAYDGDGYYQEKYGSDPGNLNRYYKWASVFSTQKLTDNLLIASDDNRHYTTINNNNTVTDVDFDGPPAYNGYYRGYSGRVWNSFALLNNVEEDGYIFMGTRLVADNNGRMDNPSKKDGSYQYYYLQADNNELKYALMSPVIASNSYSSDKEMYEIHTYTFKVKTPFDNTLSATMNWSDAYDSQNLLDHIPNALKRKYVAFDGAYLDEALTQPITTFEEAETEDGGHPKGEVWLKYTSSMPFEALPSDGNYTDARWYTIRANNVDANMVYYDAGTHRFYTGLGSNSNIHQGESEGPQTQVAFMGDPFELKIISHGASEGVGNRYIGCATTAEDGDTLCSQVGSSDISSWEIAYDATSGSMVLRQYGTYDNPKYIGWAGSAVNKPITYSSTSTRLKVVELEKKTYVYHIYNASNQIAVMASDQQDIGKPLKVSAIPELIRSPFLSLPGVIVKFYYTPEAALAVTPEMVAVGNYGDCEPHAPFNVTEVANKDIYVRYFGMAEALSVTRVHFNIDQFFNVDLNGQYLYFNKDGEGNININSKETITDDEADDDEYMWRLEGQDPYDMKVYNAGAYSDNESAAMAYINTTFADEAPLTFDVVGNAKSFVALSGGSERTFEVMAATGDTLDVTTNYYHIGRKTDNSVKMYNKSSAIHGNGSITFELTQPDANVVYYHLIDKNNTDLLQVRSRYELLYFPTDSRSPLVVQYHYYPTKADALADTNEQTENASIATLKEAGTIDDRNADGYLDVYVTYDVTDAVDMLNKKTMYLLRFNNGTPFKAEDGSDGLEETPVTPVYPYCNGDCNFFVYGQDQFDLQQQGAASTRTRWAWFLESAQNDPYHVKICSRQTETYNEDDIRAYFATYQPNDYDAIVTGLVWPNISGIQGTEYMILGSTSHSRLVTTDSISLDADHNGTPESRQRYTVKSFEQYWKTYDTVRRRILRQDATNYPANPDEPELVPDEPYVVGDDRYTSNRDYLTDEMHFHHYSKWAYAKRWNGYNGAGKTSKGWEEKEHWFQTVEMGEGDFELVPIDINPVLILLDQHGWEIMRKPLPTSPDEDPVTKEIKYAAIRPYDSPMVKEYYFWTKASKRSGFHQYYNLGQQVMVNGKAYTSTSLTELPPYYTATNLHDAKGNHLDEYVTYVVKDEYIQTYNSATGEGQPFLIQQGGNYAFYDGSTLTTPDVPTPGGMSKHIVDSINAENLTNRELWYVKPNARIDYEMGYVDASETTILNHDWTNDYTNYFSNGFDPYNIQISSVFDATKYFVTNATGATLEEGAGSLKGTYGSDPAVALGAPEDDIPCSWYDSRALAITNATFMAVQDADGHMQLMPRFDHDRRMKDFTTLTLPTDPAIDQTFTQIFRPLVYNYHIIDNEGRESLRYQSGGDMVPQTPKWFRSQLAKDFTYYKTLTSTGTNTYNLETLADEITESLASAGLTTSGTDGNHVYVRYSYDEDADFDHLLKGNWHTMTLNEKDTKYDGGIKQGNDKPSTIDKDQKIWQWKFTATPQSEPDPYAVSLYNRSQSGATSVNGQTRFALLNYYDNNTTDPTKYTLAVAGTGNTTYQFVNGSSMTTAVAATTATESGFTSTSCSYDGTKAQIVLSHDIIHEFIYKIYTNGGVFAISATQDNETIEENNHVPIVPDSIVSPLLNADQFRYYNKDNFTFSDVNIATADTTGKALTYVYGLYDDEICVRYTAYDPLATSYKVPNVRNSTGSTVAKGDGSNDASIGINNEYLYNIIWHSDNMMTGTDGNAITDGGSKDLGGSPSGQVWYFVGNDPYAITLRTHVNDVDRYVHKSGDASCNLTTTADEATTFMLLPREDNYEYGMLQITGANDRLTGYGNTLTTDEPTKFIIFALSTHMVTYHLVIANINTQVTLYDSNDQSVITVDGTTQRDLTNYPIADYPAGHVSLGDPFKVPTQMYRRNVDYFYYVGDIYNVDAYGADNGKNDELTARYKGHCVTAMGDDPDLVGKHVHIYIVYTFQGGLATNAGDGFVLNVTQNKWYTFEAQKANGTPLLAQFTNAWGMEVKEGRGTHYTNDYLWSPIGDPYGFKMFHRYTYVNSGSDNKGEPNRVMTTSTPDPFAEEKPVTMGYNNDVSDPNSVYELLADENTTQGYFKIHPVANSEGTQYYFKIFHDYEDPEDHTTPEHDYVRLSSGDDYTEFRFGLTEDLVKPYYDRAGYVGGLTTEAKAAYKAVDDNTSYSEAEKLMEKQKIVYDSDNIVHYTPGYYRLHSPEDIAGITVRYASGYTHKTELTGDGVLTTSAIPMHFYERKGVNTTFEILANGFTRSAATQGAIPISEPMYDPASVLYFYEGSSSSPLSRVQTQGLYLKGAKGQVTINPEATPTVNPADPNIEAANERAAAIMTTNAEEATPLYIMDIGGAILLIHDNVTGERRGYLKYLSFDQNDANHIHDLKLTHNTHTDHAKWLMEPVNDQGITLSVHSGGDAGEYGTTYYYSTWYAPFDVLLPDDNDAKRYVAYLCDNGHSPWAPPADLHPQVMSVYNTEANGCPVDYRGSDKFIPANTPALIATTDNAGVVKMTVPTSAPSTVTIPSGNTFSGVFLEQKLDAASPVRDVYVFGLPFTSTLTKDGDYATSGNISGTLPEQAQTGAGFYLNANPNKEKGLSKAEWTRNNLYVLANRIYYRAAAATPAPDHMRDVQYVPVIFGDGDEGDEDPKEEEEDMTKRRDYVGDNCVYDLLGRKVASANEVKAGTWYRHLQPGIYILNGHKIYVGVGWM